MAWTTPRDWVHGELVTAAIMNQHVRDNLQETAVAKAQAAGDLFYATGAHALTRLPIGSNGQILTVSGGLPVWTNAMAACDSVQRGSITIPDGSLSATATITAVDPARTILIFDGYSATDPGATADRRRRAAYIQLTNSTTVTATRGASTGQTVVDFHVIQFRAGVISSIQRGVITIPDGASSATATITAVTLAKSYLEYGGWSTATSGAPSNADWSVRVQLTNSTTVTAVRNVSSETSSVSYQVVQFV